MNQALRDAAARVLAKATTRAGKQMGLSQAELDQIASNEQDAAELVRIFKAPNSIVAGDVGNCQSWLNSFNHALGAAPIDLMKDSAGLNKVRLYLDQILGSEYS